MRFGRPSRPARQLSRPEIPLSASPSLCPIPALPLEAVADAGNPADLRADLCAVPKHLIASKPPCQVCGGRPAASPPRSCGRQTGRQQDHAPNQQTADRDGETRPPLHFPDGRSGALLAAAKNERLTVCVAVAGAPLHGVWQASRIRSKSALPKNGFSAIGTRAVAARARTAGLV